MITSLLIRSMSLLLLVSAALAQELPKRDDSSTLDFEPRLMLNDLPDIPLPAPYEIDSANPATSVEVSKLEADLAKAKKTAAWRERLCKGGVLSKVEAEQSALKVVRLTRDLETARLQVMTREVEEKRKLATAGDLSPEALAQAEQALVAATAHASATATKWEETQRAAAELRLQRERKLLAVGAGSRSAVKRAEVALQNLARPGGR